MQLAPQGGDLRQIGDIEMKPWQIEFQAMITRAAELAKSEAHGMTARGYFGDMYLYHRPGELRLTAEELPAPWELAGPKVTAAIPFGTGSVCGKIWNLEGGGVK